MARTVLVLSATGKTGRPTVDALVRCGAIVRAATRDPSTARFPDGVAPVAFDFDDAANWAPALDGVDAVYLAWPGWRADEVEVAGRVLDAVRAAGVQRVVRLSALGSENDPQGAHARIEALVAEGPWQWVVLRPTFFMDNFIHFYGHGIATDGVIALPAGDGRSGFIAAEDIGEVAAEALLGEAHAEVWPLTGPESLDHAQVAATLSDVLGRTVRYVDIDPEAHVAGMRAHGMPEIGVGIMSSLYAMVRAGHADGTLDTVERVLGRPATTFADWARAHAGAWKQSA